MSRTKLPAIKRQTSKVALALLPDIDLPFDPDQFENERISLFLRAVFFGVSFDDARSLSGLSSEEYGIWLSKGGSARSSRPVTEPEEPYRTFCELLEQVCLATKTVATANILRAIWNGDVEASKYFLERRFAREWGQHGTVPIELQEPERARVVILVPDNAREDYESG